MDGYGQIKKGFLMYELMLSRFQGNINYMHTLVGRYYNANILLNFLIESWNFLKAQVKVKKVKPNHVGKWMQLTWTHHWLDLNVEAFTMNKMGQCGAWRALENYFQNISNLFVRENVLNACEHTQIVLSILHPFPQEWNIMDSA